MLGVAGFRATLGLVCSEFWVSFGLFTVGLGMVAVRSYLVVWLRCFQTRRFPCLQTVVLRQPSNNMCPQCVLTHLYNFIPLTQSSFLMVHPTISFARCFLTHLTLFPCLHTSNNPSPSNNMFPLLFLTYQKLDALDPVFVDTSSFPDLSKLVF